MRFVTFVHNRVMRAGALEGDAGSSNDTVIDLSDPAFFDVLPEGRPEVATFVKAGLEQVARAIATHLTPYVARFRLCDVVLCAPIPRPRRIIGVAHNYVDALRERAMPPPAEPIVFEKSGDTVVGPDEPIVLPPDIGGVTYEAELAAVIGRSAHQVAADRALEYVAGYCAFNDVSASELIRRDGRFDRGKNLPTFGPMGPYLATASEIPDPQALRVRFMMDNAILQNGCTKDMLFSVAELIAFLSRDTALQPGDIIATGTPAGAAPMRKPHTWLRAGSTSTVTVEQLGSLSNPIVSEVFLHV